MWAFDCPRGDPGATMSLLILFMCLFIAPFILLHYFDYRRNFWKLGGSSLKTLQSNLLQKFLNYNEESRSSLKNSDLMMAINRDSFDLVRDGYVQLFPLVWSLTRLVLIVFLQLALAISGNGSYIAIPPVLLFPMILFTYLKIRSHKTKKSIDEKSKAQNNAVSHVEATARNFRMIADYAMRPNAVDDFSKYIGLFNAKNSEANAVKTNNAYLAPWLSTLCVGLWFIIGGKRVVDGDETLGGFLTTLGIFKEVGASWSVIYKITLSVQSALVPLARITTLMNMPTELEDRKNVNQKRKEVSDTLNDEARKLAKVTGQYAADLVPIKVIDVTYAYARKELSLDFLQHCKADFPQDSMVALVGLPGQGKSTMLKLIGGVLFPQTGVVAIPPHLRVLHISPHPVFFEGTLLQNLTYGLKKEDTDAGMERVLGICQSMRVPQHLHDFLDTDDSDDISCVWDETLSLSTRALLNLARALVNNPNVLVLHKPALYVDDDHTVSVFESLRQFVDERGLGYPAASFSHRRSRTCIFTTISDQGVQKADVVYEVKGGKLEKLEPATVSREMLG